MKKILIGCDHAAYDLIDEIVNKYPNINFVNCNKSRESVDYSDVAYDLVSNLDESVDYLVCICGTGFGITNAVLKQTSEEGIIIKCQNHVEEIFKNNLKVVGFGARTSKKELLFDFLDQM